MEPLRPVTKKLRKKIKHLLFTVAYRDRILCETVSTIDAAVPVKVWRKDGSYTWDLKLVDSGDVLIESLNRGRGSFQQ